MADWLRGLSSDFAELVQAAVPQPPLRDLQFAEVGQQMLWGDLSDAPCLQMAICTEAVFDCVSA